MPDSRHHASPRQHAWQHRDWSQAFAALPLDEPDASAWPAIAARLDAPHRARWPYWLATAAALALLTVVPLRQLADGITAPGKADLADAGPAIAPATAPATSSVADSARDQHSGALSADGLPRPTARSLRDTLPAITPAVASVTSAPYRSDPTRSDLERFYAESAQLEAVLTMVRDERVASGPAAALSGQLDAYVTTIDAALSQAALPQAQRLALWDQRVDALRQVVGLESTQRWLAASGERYDGALVSVD